MFKFVIYIFFVTTLFVKLIAVDTQQLVLFHNSSVSFVMKI